MGVGAVSGDEAKLEGRKCAAYRTLKLGSLATATLDNVLNTNIGVSDLLLKFSSCRGGCVITTAVAAVDAIVTFGLLGRTGAAIFRRLIGVGRSASAALVTTGRCAALARFSRIRPRVIRGKALCRVVRMGVWCVVGGLGIRVVRSTICGLGRLFNNSHIDHHVVAEVFISGNEGIGILVLETHATRDRWARVKAIKVLNRGDNGVCGIMRVYLNTHRQARTKL